jgi:predicted transcriptional regulator of viral defense system
MTSEYTQVRYWIDELPRKGKTTFSLKEAELQFADKPVSSVRRALARLTSSGKIYSVWNGFYSVSIPEYGLEGIAPPIDYINQLMCHLKCGYYVALLTAASYYGASHQAPQVFQVICDKILHVKSKNGIKVEPVFKKRIPNNYLAEINSRTASVKMSIPELTAIDLLLYINRAGGLNQVATVLDELAESIDFGRVGSDIFAGVPIAVIQRLGYLLDETLGKNSVADSLYEKVKQASIVFNPAPLVTTNKNSTFIIGKNAKWDIIVNYEVESDL